MFPRLFLMAVAFSSAFGNAVESIPVSGVPGDEAKKSNPELGTGADRMGVFPPSNFPLKLEERFLGKRLNRDLWNTHLEVFGRWGDRYHNDSYLNYLSDEDVLVEDGRLRLRSDLRSVEGDNPPGEYDYSSGLVSSHDKFVFTYGYIEIRAKFPGGKGVWPAFWLMPQNHQWPPEFDIAEYYAGRNLMHLGLCYGDFPDINWDSGGNNDVDFEGSWNTFGLLWLPGKAQWIQNGVVKREVLGAYVPSCPMYVILSNGVSSKIGPSGEPDQKTVFPNYFEVEYLKVWAAPETNVAVSGKPLPFANDANLKGTSKAGTP
ncbi:MAG: glycoside hydrolase family 16 protein [Verrucomicrobiota bacterium]